YACHRAAPAAPPPPLVRTALVQSRVIEQTFEWLATLDGSTNAEIRPQVTGYIVSVNYQEGSVVQRGTLLFSIDRRPFQAAVEQARGNHENAQAQLGKARADVARYTPLAAEHAISQEELVNAQAAERVAIANVESTLGAL